MIQILMILHEFLNICNKEKSHNGYIFAWVTKGMYGLTWRPCKNPRALWIPPLKKKLVLWTHLGS